MYYYHTNDEIDEIGEGIIRKYNYQAFIQGDPTDIEGFIADHLNYRIVYDRLADKDAGRMAFLADGKDTMWVWRDGKRVEVIPPEGMIVIDEFLRQEKNKTRRRFVLAHEAGHIIMDLLNNKPVTAAYNKAIFNCKADVVCHLQMSFGFSAPIRGKASEIEMRMNRFNTECKISDGHYLSTALTFGKDFSCY